MMKHIGIDSSSQHDYFIRAKRIAEIPILENQYQEQINEDRRFHEQQEDEKVGVMVHLVLRVVIELEHRSQLTENISSLRNYVISAVYVSVRNQCEFPI